MGKHWGSALILSAVIGLAGCGGRQLGSALPAPPEPSAGAGQLMTLGSATLSLGYERHAAVCPGPAARGTVRCHALMRTDIAPVPNARLQSPSGYGPADLRSAYNLVAGAGSGQLVAIVDAFDDPKAESDLSVYRSTYGLTPCTTANGCFKKVNQNGVQGSYPTKNGSWAAEISLDLDMVSAICPNCRILLVEANDNSFYNIGQSVIEAAKFAPAAISNSYGAEELVAPSYFNGDYNHPGIAVVASSGDGGYYYGLDVNLPASSQYVTAVGGTTLSRSGGSRGWTETAWSGAGSGCSSIFPKPAWQVDKGCAKRMVADVSAVADPATGVSVYDTVPIPGYNFSGWLVLGGTSVSSPIVASIYAIAGNAASITYGSYPYNHTSSLFDVTKGSNGTCNPSYFCTAQRGYDGPTGLGTPNGMGAF